MPETKIIVIREKDRLEIERALYGEPIQENPLKRYPIARAAEKLGYPVFMRTDQASGKHQWRDTCYVDKPEKLFGNIVRVIEANLLAGVVGLPWKAIVLRKYIEMDSRFTAFRGLPIAPERRYFVSDGEVVCHHPYWPEDAIEQGFHSPPLPENWRRLLSEINTETEDEIEVLTRYAEEVAQRVKGAWSIDFCRARDGRWILIDMAVAELSWHPPTCPHSTSASFEGD